MAERGTFLDLGELIQQNKDRDGVRLKLFREVLHRCHDLIKRKNKERLKSTKYEIPYFMVGRPKYDQQALSNYLYHHLTENGFYVEYLGERKLYISWDECDLNLTKYHNTKSRLDYEFRQKYIGGNDQIDQENPLFNISENTMKFRQSRQQQIKEDRENRFRYQEDRFGPMTGTYSDYKNRYRRGSY